MHDLLGVHFLQPKQNSTDDLPYFVMLEFMFGLDFVVEQSSFEQFHHYVKRVIRLEDLKELHAVFVAEAPHDLNLLDEALFSLVFTVGCLLRKSLDCIAPSVFYLLSEIDRCKVSFADLLLGFELLMKASLVELGSQNLPPALELFLRVEVKHYPFLYFFEEDGRRIVLK